MSKKPRIWVAVVAVACAMGVLLALALPGAGAAGDKPAGKTKAGEVGKPASFKDLPYCPGEVIVKFKGGLADSVKGEAKSLAGVDGVVSSNELEAGNASQVLSLEPGVTVEQAVARLQASGTVVYAEPNYKVQASYTPNDPHYAADQWGLNNTGQNIEGQAGTADADIDAPEAWNLERGTAVPTTVAVIDSGIDKAHPDLDAKDVTGYNYAGIAQLDSTNYWTFGKNTSSQKVAQTIKGTGGKLDHIGFYLAKNGSPSKSITVSVRTSLGGSDLASATISPSEVSSSYFNIIYKKLSKSVTLTNGKTYYLMCRTSNLNSSNHYWIVDNVGTSNYNTYAEGKEYWLFGSTWTPFDIDDFVFRTNGNSNPHDDNGHGTHCSGNIGAETNNSTGVAGGCPGAKIMPLKVLCSSGGGYTSHINSAIKYAADHGAKVISMSLGGTGFAQSQQDAINYAYGKGVTIFASSGNSGDSTMSYPAGCSNVIGVGATDNRDTIASFSTYNSSVDVSAPGVSVYSTMPTYTVNINNADPVRYTKYYCYMDGTSMACPMAAGLGALVLSRSPTLTPAQVQQKIQANADDKGVSGRDDYFGWGRINANATLNNTTATPGIGSLSPTAATTGSYLTINGNNFGGTRGTSYVAYGSTNVSSPTSYSSWGNTQIKVKVPSTISKVTTVKVYVGGVASNGKTFKVIPKITSLSPTSGKRGSTLTINGTAFGSSRSTSYVKIGGVKVATYYSWSNTKIVVKVPSSTPYGSQAVKVTTSGGTSSGKTFTVKH